MAWLGYRRAGILAAGSCQQQLQVFQHRPEEKLLSSIRYHGGFLRQVRQRCDMSVPRCPRLGAVSSRPASTLPLLLCSSSLTRFHLPFRHSVLDQSRAWRSIRPRCSSLPGRQVRDSTCLACATTPAIAACTASIDQSPPPPPRSLFIGHLDQHVCGAPQIISSRCTDLHTRPRDANSYSRTLYHYAVQPELIQALVCWVKIKPHNLQLEE